MQATVVIGTFGPKYIVLFFLFTHSEQSFPPLPVMDSDLGKQLLLEEGFITMLTKT